MQTNEKSFNLSGCRFEPVSQGKEKKKRRRSNKKNPDLLSEQKCAEHVF